MYQSIYLDLVRKEKMIATSDCAVATEPETSFPEFSGQFERDLIQVFRLLADQTRFKMLIHLLRERELHVTALCERVQQSQTSASHHLALMRDAGLIERRRDGKYQIYSVSEPYFGRLMTEFFKTTSDPTRNELRFQNFVLTQ